MDAPASELTFSILDDLAPAVIRKRVDPTSFLASYGVVRIGPFLELLLLDRASALPLEALPSSPVREALASALAPVNASRGTYGSTGDVSFGFITTGRDIEQAHSQEELLWVGFRQKAQQAAEFSLPKPIAQGMIGAMTEIEENIHLHSGRPSDGVVGFRGTKDEFEFVVADSGIGMLASLRHSPDYANLADTGKALRLALQDGESRLRYMSQDHGYGFKNLFRALATLNGELRFRSDDQAVTIDGVAPELVKAELRQRTLLQGFCASIVCRPRALSK